MSIWLFLLKLLHPLSRVGIKAHAGPKRSQSNLPSKYYPGQMLLNYNDPIETDVSNRVKRLLMKLNLGPLFIPKLKDPLEEGDHVN